MVYVPPFFQPHCVNELRVIAFPLFVFLSNFSLARPSPPPPSHSFFVTLFVTHISYRFHISHHSLRFLTYSLHYLAFNCKSRFWHFYLSYFLLLSHAQWHIVANNVRRYCVGRPIIILSPAGSGCVNCMWIERRREQAWCSFSRARTRGSKIFEKKIRGTPRKED